jgi:hypothetical protein
MSLWKGKPNKVSIDDQSFVINDQSLEFVKLGRMFTIREIVQISQDATYYMVFDPTNAVVSPPEFTGRIIIYPLNLKASQGMVLTTLFFGGAYSGGSAITPINRNEESVRRACCRFRKGVTIDTPGQEGFGYMVGTDSTNQSSGGGEELPSQPFVSTINTIKYIKIENLSGDDIYFRLAMDFAEL